MKAKWIKRSNSIFKNGHEYEIIIKPPANRSYVYEAHIIYDITLNEEADFYYQFASMTSIKQSLKCDKIELDND